MHYVIGDIHGQLVCLKELLRKINYKPEEDVLYFVGDYIDWGPASVATVQFIIELQRKGNVHCCLGNHELMFNEVIKDKWKIAATKAGKTNYARNKGDETLKELDELSFQEQINVIRWLNNLPVYFIAEVNGQRYYITHSTPLSDACASRTPADAKWKLWAVEDAVWDRIHYPNDNFLEWHPDYHDCILVSGHSITPNYKINKYEHYINVDCGAKVIGWEPYWTTENLAALRLEDGAEFYVFEDNETDKISRQKTLEKIGKTHNAP